MLKMLKMWMTTCTIVSSTKSSKTCFIQPTSTMQQKYMDSLLHPDIPMVVAHGPAGCGKTLLACDAFARSYQQGTFSRLILTRPSIPVNGENLGFLPGTMHEKMAPWTQPIFDILQNYFTIQEINTMIQKKKIDIVPLAFMRGRTFHHCFILGDEMQNSTPSQWLTLVSRCGLNSKLVLTGDLLQSDLDNSSNGLHHFISKQSTHPFTLCSTITLDHDSVSRSPLVQKYLQWNDRPATFTE